MSVYFQTDGRVTSAATDDRRHKVGDDYSTKFSLIEGMRSHIFAARKRIANLEDDQATKEAEIERLNATIEAAVLQISDLATKLGEAEGKLLASETFGVVEGWRRRAEKAEAERDAALARVEELESACAAQIHDEERRLALTSQPDAGLDALSQRLLNMAALPGYVGEREACRAAADAITTLRRRPVGEVKVKALVWTPTEFFGDDATRWESEEYSVRLTSFNNRWKVTRQPDGGNVRNGVSGYPSSESAKAAAQNDYNQRILSAMDGDTK